MKKLFTLLSVVALTASMSFAQTQYGAALGFNFANQYGADDDTDMRLGIRIGLDMQRELSRSVNLHTGLLYSVKGASAKVEVYDLSGFYVGDYDIDRSLNYLEIPVNFGFVMSDNFSLMAGFYSAFIVGSTVTLDGPYGSSTSSTDDLNPIDFGLSFGMQIGLSDAFSLNAGYQLGLTSIDDDGGDAKNSNILIGASYAFGGGRY
jgi:hypothetical protein